MIEEEIRTGIQSLRSLRQWRLQNRNKRRDFSTTKHMNLLNLNFSKIKYYSAYFWISFFKITHLLLKVAWPLSIFSSCQIFPFWQRETIFSFPHQLQCTDIENYSFLHKNFLGILFPKMRILKLRCWVTHFGFFHLRFFKQKRSRISSRIGRPPVLQTFARIILLFCY